MRNADQLKILAKQLYDLLDNPEYGCATWYDAVHDKIDEIAEFHRDR